MPTKPAWKDFHRIGAPIVHSVEGVKSFEEIRAVMGLKSRQEAYHICCVAVGKLVCTARRIDADTNHRGGSK